MAVIVIPKAGRGVSRAMLDQMYIDFSDQLKRLQRQIGFRISARGWCYIMEQNGLINKDQFDLVNNAINNCRKKGYLPVDFTAEESARQFKGVEEPTTEPPGVWLRDYLNYIFRCENTYIPEWWADEEYYIQMVVEKVDLVTLFRPICEKFHIPIANAKGWSSISQRAEYARRFKEAEANGLKCVLLYCGDHDPDGLRIGEFLRKNLADIKDITWNDGEDGYDPVDLEIDRFGLNHSFIATNGLTWIDNLITGSGKNLASPTHPNYDMEYVQEYLKRYGARKCEANAIVQNPKAGQDLCLQAIEKYLGTNAEARFQVKIDRVREWIEEYRQKLGIEHHLTNAIGEINKGEAQRLPVRCPSCDFVYGDKMYDQMVADDEEECPECGAYLLAECSGCGKRLRTDLEDVTGLEECPFCGKYSPV